MGDCDGSVSFTVSYNCVLLLKHGGAPLIPLKQCGGSGTLYKKVLPFLIVPPCVIGASWIVMIFWVKQLYAEFGLVAFFVHVVCITYQISWAIFHVVGANPKMKSKISLTRYRLYY